MPPKVKVVKKKIVDEDIADIFNQLLGTDGVNLTYAWPRYLRLKTLATKALKLITIINSCEHMDHYRTVKEATEDWVAQRSIDISVTFPMTTIGAIDFAGVLSYEEVTDSVKDQFAASYESCKKFPLFRHMSKWAANFEHYKTSFDKITYMGDPREYAFLTSMSGSQWLPIEPVKINFKEFFNTCKDLKIKSLVLSAIARLYEICKTVGIELCSPDVDVDRFVNIVADNIDKLKQVPELHRCTGAFSKIKQSIDLLKKNFNGYYSDFVNTKDSTIIMQHFVLDVAGSTKADAKTTQEFRKIMMYYRKVANQRGQNDPKVNALFDKIEEKFSSIGKSSSVEVEDNEE